MANRSTAKSIAGYIAEPLVTIRYAIPAFDLDGRHLLHFAEDNRHIDFYPGGRRRDAHGRAHALQERQGSVQLPLGRPLPMHARTLFRGAEVEHACLSESDEKLTPADPMPGRCLRTMIAVRQVPPEQRDASPEWGEWCTGTSRRLAPPGRHRETRIRPAPRGYYP
jgi:hypothetical protein